MVQTIIVSIPAVVNVSALASLLLYVYAVFGVNLFFAVNYTPPQAPLPGDFYFDSSGSNWGVYVDRHANFFNFGRALLTLMRISTGENYNGIMHELMADSWADNALRCCPSCGPVVDGHALSSCGRSVESLVFFISFQMLFTFVIISLFVAVFVRYPLIHCPV